MSRTKLIILVAGKGERLRPITETRPKPLIPILGKSLLCRHLEKLTKLVDPETVILVTSYMKEVIASEASRCYGGKLAVVDQGGELGTGDAIRKAVEVGGDGRYLVVYGDLYLTDRAYEVIASMRPYSLLASDVEDPWNYGVLELSGERVTRVVEKPPRGAEPSRSVYSGALAVDSDFLKYLSNIRPSPRGELEVTDAITEAAKEVDIRAVKVERSDWLDVGRPWDYLLATRRELDALKSQIVRGEVHPSAILEGPVIVEEGAEVGPYVMVEGPAYIGPKARVGPHTHIRPYTAVHEGAKLGYAVEVKASIMLERSAAPHLNYVGDSIIGEHVNLGAGTITANLRFDHGTIKMTVKGERIDTGLNKLGAVMGGYSQTGINVSLMPGVKVGSHAIIYPGCVVTRDVAQGEVYNCWPKTRG